MVKNVKHEFTFPEYFPGSVPSGLIFAGNVADLRTIVAGSQSKKMPNPIAEVSLIGLLAHFEAFCKGHFASIINICPELIRQLAMNGRDTRVDASQLMLVGAFSARHLGFLIAESYDFGTAKGINRLYLDLLKCSPFSSKEILRFDRMIDDRNLLVHHGGIFTAKYAGQRIAKHQVRGKVYVDSLVVTENDFMDAANFLLQVTSKTTKATGLALKGFMESNGIEISETVDDAIDAMTWE